MGMRACLTVCLTLALLFTRPQLRAEEPETAAIRSVIAAQVASWNRGEIEAFMQSYEDSPETIFIGAKVRKGYRPILERYREAYRDKAQMGTLSYSELEVRLLPGSNGAIDYAIVTGRFHLERSTKGEASKDDGIFSLLWHKSPVGWRILLDHTS